MDVGCATGYYMPALMKIGTVEGIDISEKAVKTAKEMGLKNCRVGKIFSFHANAKYDTITLLQNNLGMAENLPKSKRMLKILAGLLRKNGQILLIHRKTKEKYRINKIEIQWENKRARFMWIYHNARFLSDLCNEAGLNMEIVDKNRNYNLIRMTIK